MSDLAHEIQVALRGLCRDRAFALPVLLTLTLCIAANGRCSLWCTRCSCNPFLSPAPIA